MIQKIKDAFEIIDTNIQKYNELKKLLKNIENLSTNKSNKILSKSIDSFNNNYTSFLEKSNITNNKIEEIIQSYLNNSQVLFNNTQNHSNILESNTSLIVDSSKEKNIIQDNLKIIEKNIDKTVKSSIQKEQENHSTPTTNCISKESLNKNNKTLIISEKQGKVYLPYTSSDLEKFLETGNYSNIDEVIEKNYIVPLNRFKHPILSRFKEAFYLMKNKEKANLTSCLDLAFELSLNSLLNPAIILACKSLDELDIYLDYLDNNELDKFTIFDIKYEVAPLPV